MSGRSGIEAAIYGRLGADPVERTTRQGNAMATAPVAVDVTDGDGPERTVWVSVAAFGSVAERLLRHRKGDLVAMQGPLTLNVWTDRDGHERESWRLVAWSVVSARTVRPGGRRRQAGSGAEPAQAEPAPHQRRAQEQAPEFDDPLTF